jgi:hypothetical protein
MTVSTFQDQYDALMAEIDEMPVREALASGKAYRCPRCRLIHPGIRYAHPDHKRFCSTHCFRRRREFEDE